MPQFAFRATDGMGNIVEGTVAADSPLLAKTRVQQMGYTPVRVQEAGEQAAAPDTAPRTEPTVSMPAHPGPVDLTQPITEMPAATNALLVPLNGESGEAVAMERLEPWQRGGPVPQPPAPHAVTQPMTPLGQTTPALPQVYQTPVSQGVTRPGFRIPAGQGE